MKNKWLIGLLSGALAATLCFGLVACAPKEEEKKSDADLAQAAINTVKVLYEKDTSTPKDYTVIGQTKVGDNMYPIAWSVSSDVSDIDNYVKIGTMDQSTKLITIGITQGEQDVSYTLKASVTVGEATETAEFAKKIPAKAVVNNDGSAEHPFTVTDAIAIGSSLANGEFYQVGGKNARVHIKGLVVNPGSFQAASGQYPDELARVFIADDVDAEEADQVKIQYILFNAVMENPGNNTSPLGKGDEIVVWGFIERYNDATTIYYAKEEEDGETKYPELTSWKKAEKTDADKVAEAKDALKIGETEYRVTGTFDVLPASQGDATITWALKAASDAVEVDSGKLKVKSLPDTDAKATLVATLKCGEATDTKEFEITVGKAETPEHKGTESDPYTVADLFKVTKTIVGNSYLGGKDAPTQIYAKGIVVKVDGWSDQYKNWTKVYIAASLDAASANQVQVYKLGLDETYLEKEADLVVGAEITLCGYLQKYNGKVEVSDNGKKGDESIIVKAVEYTKPGEPVKVKGSAENPYTVAEAIAEAKTLAADAYIGGDTPKCVAVKGYVIEVGSWSEDYGNFTGTWIADTATSTKTSADAIQVYRLYLDSANLKCWGDLAKGAEITVWGYLQNYKGKNDAAVPQVTYNGQDKVNPSAVAYKDNRTAAQKVADVKGVYELPTVLREDVNVPASPVTGVTVTLTSNNAAIKVENGKLVITRGADDVTVKVTAAIACGDKTDTKEFTVVVKKEISIPAGQSVEGNLGFKTNFATFGAEWASSYTSHTLDFTALGVSNLDGTVVLSNANKQSDTIADMPVLCAKNTAQYVTINLFTKGTITSVEFTLKQWAAKTFKDIHIEYSTDGKTWTKCSEVITTPGKIASNAAIPAGATVRLSYVATENKNTQVGLESIKINVKAPEAAATSVAPVAILPGKEF